MVGAPMEVGCGSFPGVGDGVGGPFPGVGDGVSGPFPGVVIGTSVGGPLPGVGIGTSWSSISNEICGWS